MEDATDVLRSQQEGCKGLQLIFDDVLEAQRIEQGRLKLRNEVVDTAQVLDDIAATFRRTAQSKGVRLVADVGREVPDHIHGDPVRIKQVIANLVSNALKFTPSGGAIQVHLENVIRGALDAPQTQSAEVLYKGNQASAAAVHVAEPAKPVGGQRLATVVPVAHREKKVRLRLSVSDTGCGMSAKSLARLFRPYEQTRHGQQYSGSSSGLGLYISRGLARQMRGDLVASSEGEGMGSVFTFEFEARCQDGEPSVSSTTAVGAAGLVQLQQHHQQQRAEREEMLNEGATNPPEQGQHVAECGDLSKAHVRTAGADLFPDDRSAVHVPVQATAAHRSDACAAPRAGHLREETTKGAAARGGVANIGDASRPHVAVAAVDRSDQLKQWCLIVDDVPTNRKLLARGMRRLGYSVYQAKDGQKAVEACRVRAQQAGPGVKCLGLITMDKSMPVMDGVEATQAIRSEFDSRFVIVGLTGDALGEDLEAFKAAGLDEVLGKPASAREVDAVAVRLV